MLAAVVACAASAACARPPASESIAGQGGRAPSAGALTPAGAGAFADAMFRERVDSATRAFLRDWRAEWEALQDRGRAPMFDDPRLASLDDRTRRDAVHCHAIETPSTVRDRLVKGTTRAHAACPGWLPPERRIIQDERLSTDGAIAFDRRAWVRQRRGALRVLLDTAAHHFPADTPLTHLRLRLALDDHDLAGAAAVALGCELGPAQCGLLQAFVLHKAGRVVAADSAYLAALASMPDAERCEWRDVGPLFDAELRRRYEAMPCAERIAVEERLWWVADPLYVERGNERRVEHYSRQVQRMLVATPGHDPRQRWTPEKGGDATTEVLVRYGWPTQLFWGGRAADRGHDGWLIQQGMDTAPPYVVPEYTRGRIHAVPAARAIMSPFDAAHDDWQLNAPAGDDDWWPIEHYARDSGAIAQLGGGQSVMLRRRHAARFVWAGDLETDALGRPAGERVVAELMQSRGIGDAWRVASFAGHVGARLLVDSPLPAGSTLVAIEYPRDGARPAGRTRFGATVPPSLSALGRELALSQPVLFAPGATDDVLDAEAAIARMFGTTTLSRIDRLGVYWEAYGYRATDTVDIEIEVAREERSGVLSRITDIFRIGGQEGQRVGLRWRETPQNMRAIQRREGTVPLQMRSIVLETSRLPRGRYRMQLSMSRNGGPAYTSIRRFELR